jgi:hypothetical protein
MGWLGKKALERFRARLSVLFCFLRERVYFFLRNTKKTVTAIITVAAIRSTA